MDLKYIFCFPRQFLTPPHLSSRERFSPDANNLEFTLSRRLYNVVLDVVRSQTVQQKHVSKFIILTSLMRPAVRGKLAVFGVLFEGVIDQIPLAPHTYIDFWSIFKLLISVMRPLPPDRPLGIEPLSQVDLKAGLCCAYVWHNVSPYHSHPPRLNYRFHYFASSLYGLGILRDPDFFVCAMHDVLELSSNDTRQLNMLLNPVGQWIKAYGAELFQQAKHGWKSGDAKLLEHGYLYKLELNKTYGEQHPAPGLTIHRWRFWLKRLEDAMVKIVECERPPESTGENNVARRAARRMAQLLSKYDEEEARKRNTREMIE
ncbi:hypothetical protein F4677DRAFT_449250 [Hypoxylon crocopeplum]|nr:hypothetical protein F4677DRAFT_449250 [Hypoxylon crocopeplum]